MSECQSGSRAVLETEINGSGVFLRTQEPEKEAQMGCQVTWERRLENYGHVFLSKASTLGNFKQENVASNFQR